MTDRSCPYHQYCYQRGSCDDCVYHIKFDSYKKQIRQLKRKIEALQTQWRLFLEIDDTRLNELLNADKEGRIVILPCSLTTPIYLVTSSKVNGKVVEKVEKANIDHFTIGELKTPMITACTDENEWYDYIDGTKQNEEFFLTEQEAKQKLQKN